MMSKPLVALAPQGTPAVISYNISEPTSYSGRNIIELELEAEDFTDDKPIVDKPGSYTISDRLKALTNADVQSAASADKHVIVSPNISGKLDYNIVPSYPHHF
jgi:hypothetical protein